MTIITITRVREGRWQSFVMPTKEAELFAKQLRGKHNISVHLEKVT